MGIAGIVPAQKQKLAATGGWCGSKMGLSPEGSYDAMPSLKN